MGIAMAINRKVIGCTRLYAIGLAVMLGVSLPAGAQDMPGEHEITPALALEVPLWWSIESVNIEATVNDGDEVDLRIRQRFTAVVQPLEDLFEHVDTVGPFKVMIPVRSSGEAQKLYGIAFSALHLGKWLTKIQLGNSVEHLGTPQSFYEGPTVIVGTEGFEKSSETMRILGFLKTRWQDSLSSLDSAVDRMKEESREVLSELAGQIQTKMDAARETLAAIEQAIAETAAQKQLTEALEERVAESNRAIEARKKLYQALRTQLASDDADEQLAAFQSIFVSDQYELSEQERQDLLAIVLQSEDPSMQGAALFQIFARKPDLPMKRIKRTGGENGMAPVEDHILSFKVTQLYTNYQFKGSLKFNRKGRNWPASGTIHGDQLILKADKSSYPHHTFCVWNASVEDDGVLRGELECSGTDLNRWEHDLSQSASGVWETRFFF